MEKDRSPQRELQDVFVIRKEEEEKKGQKIFELNKGIVIYSPIAIRHLAGRLSSSSTCCKYQVCICDLAPRIEYIRAVGRSENTIKVSIWTYRNKLEKLDLDWCQVSKGEKNFVSKAAVHCDNISFSKCLGKLVEYNIKFTYEGFKNCQRRNFWHKEDLQESNLGMIWSDLLEK